MPVPAFQLFTALFWLVVFVITIPGLLRLLFGQIRVGDQSKAGWFFASLIFMGGSARWLIAPGDVFTWKLVYLSSMVLAVYVVVTIWNLRRDR